MIEIEINTPFTIDSEAEMVALGQALASHVLPGQVVYLCGDLGVGKTTLARAFIRALGFEGRIKSPSYGLIEVYTMPQAQVAHIDLYRLGHPEEVADLGLEAYLGSNWVVLIEWPERGKGYVPAADWQIMLSDEINGSLLPKEARAVLITQPR